MTLKEFNNTGVELELVKGISIPSSLTTNKMLGFFFYIVTYTCLLFKILITFS